MPASLTGKRPITRFILLMGGFVLVLWALAFAFAFHHLTPREFAFSVMVAGAAMFIAVTVLFQKERARIFVAASAPLAPSARRVLQGAVLIVEIWIVLEIVILIALPFANRDDSLIANLGFEGMGLAFTAFLIMLVRKGKRRLQEGQIGE